MREKEDNMSYEDKICEAISLMVDKAVSEANFDRTIQAIVQECSDASIGKYKVKYQDMQLAQMSHIPTVLMFMFSYLVMI